MDVSLKLQSCYVSAKKWNVSQRRVAIYCKEGRIEGAFLWEDVVVQSNIIINTSDAYNDFSDEYKND